VRTIAIFSLGELEAAATEFAALNKDKKIIAFYGEMGAGKTTFIKALCKSLGVEGVTGSPTFSLINPYQNASGEKIFHFDFYRINDETEAYDMGYEDYFYSGALCLIEWPEKIEKLLPPETVRVRLEVKEGTRLLTILS